MNPRRLGSLIAVLAIFGCSLSTLNRDSVVRFHGEATDPIGDTSRVPYAHVARPPDLVYARVQVTNSALRFTVRFARGSLDPLTTDATFDLDADLDPRTGAEHFSIGADYLVGLDAGPMREASLGRAVNDEDCALPAAPCRFEPVQRFAVVLSNDEMDAVIPRSLFARFDGRLNFRVIAYATLDGGRRITTTDHMPNDPLRFVAVR